MVPTTLRNTLSAYVPTPGKDYVAKKVFFSPTVGRILRLIGPQIAEQVFEHLYTPVAYMNELHRILKPGGCSTLPCRIWAASQLS